MTHTAEQWASATTIPLAPPDAVNRWRLWIAGDNKPWDRDDPEAAARRARDFVAMWAGYTVADLSPLRFGAVRVSRELIAASDAIATKERLPEIPTITTRNGPPWSVLVEWRGPGESQAMPWPVWSTDWLGRWRWTPDPGSGSRAFADAILTPRKATDAELAPVSIAGKVGEAIGRGMSDAAAGAAAQLNVPTWALVAGGIGAAGLLVWTFTKD